MNSNLLSFVLDRLDRRTPNWSEVARASGVPYSTLKKIASRVTPNPGVQHVQALADYFMGQEAQNPHGTPGLASQAPAGQGV